MYVYELTVYIYACANSTELATYSYCSYVLDNVTCELASAQLLILIYRPM